MLAINSVGIWQFFWGIVVCMVVSVYLLGLFGCVLRFYGYLICVVYCVLLLLF